MVNKNVIIHKIDSCTNGILVKRLNIDALNGFDFIPKPSRGYYNLKNNVNSQAGKRGQWTPKVLYECFLIR